jgi:hypothetical protein
MENATTSLIVLKELAGHPPTHLDPLQQFLSPHLQGLIYFWFSVWCVTGVVLLIKLWQEYHEQKRQKHHQDA